MKGRLFIITIFIALFIGTVIIIGSAINSTTSPKITKQGFDQEALITQEGGVFTRSDMAQEYLNMPDGDRTMATYYNNRAYPGAPPMITHPLLSDKGIGGKACLQCHQNGGYVNQFEAFAPVTPHPEWLNCRQCHLPTQEVSMFKNTDWVKPQPPKLGQKALITSPIVMPHGLQNRENCLSCHAGPAAPKEIRVSHPERINCRQCHVPKTMENTFHTPVLERKAYQREIRGQIESQDTIIDAKKDEIKDWIDTKGNQ